MHLWYFGVLNNFPINLYISDIGEFSYLNYDITSTKFVNYVINSN